MHGDELLWRVSGVYTPMIPHDRCLFHKVKKRANTKYSWISTLFSSTNDVRSVEFEKACNRHLAAQFSKFSRVRKPRDLFNEYNFINISLYELSLQ